MPLVKAKLTEDKTLWVKVGNVEQIGRVIIEDGSTFCKVFYADRPIEQDPFIDKIRAEIEQRLMSCCDRCVFWDYTKSRCREWYELKISNDSLHKCNMFADMGGEE